MSVTNTKWVLKERPQGLVKNENFELIKEELRNIQDGEVLIENQYLSFDPTPVSYTHLRAHETV